MGGVIITLKNLFDNYKEYGEIINSQKDGAIDLKNLKCTPTTMLPLLCDCKNKNLKLNNGQSAFEYLEDVLKNNELFSRLPESRIQSDETDFLAGYVSNLDPAYGSYFVLRHVISELANNVYDHARENEMDFQSYILSKSFEESKKLDIGVIDDGISIPRLFEKHGVDNENDCDSISEAIGTFSTVSDEYYERGNGLRTIVRLIAEGNNGELLIVSRNASLHIMGEKYKYYLLNEEHMFNGTLVSIRLNKSEVQNIYGLLEPQNLNYYKYDGVFYDY